MVSLVVLAMARIPTDIAAMLAHVHLVKDPLQSHEQVIYVGALDDCSVVAGHLVG
jgi:hypothetical protein